MMYNHGKGLKFRSLSLKPKAFDFKKMNGERLEKECRDTDRKGLKAMKYSKFKLKGY